MGKVDYQKMWSNWKEITYPLGNHHIPEFVYQLWKKIFCKRGFHLFDEVGSCLGHYIVCDACQLRVPIDDNYVEPD